MAEWKVTIGGRELTLAEIDEVHAALVMWRGECAERNDIERYEMVRNLVHELTFGE